MANQIGLFFRAQGDAAVVNGVADHIKKYWDPSMRKAILAYCDAGGTDLEPNVHKAIEKLRHT